jgi:hypothetical protein
MAGGDIGAAAARRQGDLAENLYPFKLVSSAGLDESTKLADSERCMTMGQSVWDVIALEREVRDLCPLMIRADLASSLSQRHLDGP